MNTKKLLLTIAVISIPAASAFAGDNETGARASAGVDYKIVKGFHLNVDEELRLGDGLDNIDRLQTTVGLSYKPLKYLKIGAGYTLLNPYSESSDAFSNPRHRFFVSATGYLPVGDFQFSLKETFRYTHRTGDFNKYQSTPNAIALKSRIGVKYKASKKFRPGLYAEMRTQLNSPWGYTYGSQATNASGKTYYPYKHTGYSHKYNDRYRIELNADWNITKHHTLTPYVLFDIYSRYDIDANSAGDRLFSADYTDFNKFTLGLSYVFSF